MAKYQFVTLEENTGTLESKLKILKVPRNG